jgi:hypothetical protein
MSITDIQMAVVLVTVAAAGIYAYIRMNRTYNAAVAHEIGHGVMVAYYGAYVGYIHMTSMSGGVTAFGKLVDETPVKLASAMLGGYVAEELHAGRVPSADIFDGSTSKHQYSLDMAEVAKLNLSKSDLMLALNNTISVLTDPRIHEYALSLERTLAKDGELGSDVVVVVP